MSNIRKFIVLVFTVLLVTSFQFNGSLTKKINNNSSFFNNIVEKISIPEANAAPLEPCTSWGCPGGWDMCAEINGSIWCFTRINW
jgi:hypothetical protein